jgi:hypothetical protein
LKEEKPPAVVQKEDNSGAGFFDQISNSVFGEKKEGDTGSAYAARKQDTETFG